MRTHLQIKDLNSGTFGFVQLCRNKLTKEHVAIKFMERGDKVTLRIPFALGHSPATCSFGGSHVDYKVCRARDPKSQKPNAPSHRAIQGGKEICLALFLYLSLIHI